MVLAVKTLIVTSCFIPYSGMENSLYKDEGVLINKWSYGLRTPFMSLLGYHRIGKGEMRKGDIVLFNNPMPRERNVEIDDREIYISRCIALPGDTITLNKDMVAIDANVFSPDKKELYAYESGEEEKVSATLQELGIAQNTLSGFTRDGKFIRGLSNYEYYLVSQRIGHEVDFTKFSSRITENTYQLVIPGKGIPVKVHPWNAKLLCNAIISHEHKAAHLQHNTIYIGNSPVQEYTFTKDYYWMASNDPANMNDSRLFGFVPEDHVIGKAERIWYSSDIRRVLKKVE